ncbi:MAG: PqiC family protein [Marinomonas hwangdonensis]|nr:PqiC family protein [Marinomonas hwangdonensis]
MSLRLFVWGVIAWLMVGCATPISPSKEYLLTDEALSTVRVQSTNPVFIQLMPVSMANYLVGNEMVLVTRQGQVHRSKNNLWAEPLSSQLGRLIQQRLESALPDITWVNTQAFFPQDAYELHVEIDTFFADLEGVTMISGRWYMATKTGELLLADTFNATNNMQSDGYQSMVKALSQSWSEQVITNLTQEIARYFQ